MEYLRPITQLCRNLQAQWTSFDPKRVFGVVISDEKNSGFKRGDRVLSNGPHAEVVRVSRNLTARIPDSVSFESAVFTPVASIGLQGIRLASLQIGETVVVMGLGLIGLLIVQMLVAQGCRVIGLDYDDAKLKLAETYGAEVVALDGKTSPLDRVMQLNGGIGVDAVLIAASTSSSDPVVFAAQMSRKRGKIVLIGVTGLSLNRADFYEKELTFQVSCSYGPGRYDEEYENKGNDYPLGFVRWTEKRNFEAVLRMMETGAIDAKYDCRDMLKNPFTTVFTGAHGRANGLDAVLDTASELILRGRSDIRLLFIGEGGMKSYLVKRSQDEKLTNCEFCSGIPKTELIALLAKADVGLMCLANVPAFYYGTSPNKFFDYLAAGLPVLNNYPGWVASIEQEEKVGTVVPPDSPVEFADALCKMADNPAMMGEMSINARVCANTRFNRRSLANEFVDFIENAAHSH